MFYNSIDFLCRFYVFLYLNLPNFIKITKLTTVNFFDSWYSLQSFESKLAFLVSIILSGYVLPYLLSMRWPLGVGGQLLPLTGPNNVPGFDHQTIADSIIKISLFWPSNHRCSYNQIISKISLVWPFDPQHINVLHENVTKISRIVHRGNNPKNKRICLCRCVILWIYIYFYTFTWIHVYIC